MVALTPEQVRVTFEQSGVTVADWARTHGFPPSVVYALLAGRSRGRRGDAHRAAIALRLKIGSNGLEDFVLPIPGSLRSGESSEDDQT